MGMKGKVPFIAGTAVLAVVGIGYLEWRYRLRGWSEAIAGDPTAEAITDDEVFEAGQLGREVRVLTGLLAICLVGMWVTSRVETPAVAVGASEAFGFGSYL